MRNLARAGWKVRYWKLTVVVVCTRNTKDVKIQLTVTLECIGGPHERHAQNQATLTVVVLAAVAISTIVVCRAKDCLANGMHTLRAISGDLTARSPF